MNLSQVIEKAARGNNQSADRPVQKTVSIPAAAFRLLLIAF